MFCKQFPICPTNDLKIGGRVLFFCSKPDWCTFKVNKNHLLQVSVERFFQNVKFRIQCLSQMSEPTFRFIILTGPPGCGKTTLVKKVCEILRAKNYAIDGFYTEEVRNGRDRAGFDIVLMNGGRSPLARVQSENCNKPTVGKYAVEVECFENSVLPVLNFENENSILILDEIGKMELLSHKFKEFVSKLINTRKRIILATVPSKTMKLIPVVEKIKIHPDTSLIHIDRENRNVMVNKVADLLINAKEKFCS